MALLDKLFPSGSVSVSEGAGSINIDWHVYVFIPGVPFKASLGDLHVKLKTCLNKVLGIDVHT